MKTYSQPKCDGFKKVAFPTAAYVNVN